MIERDFRPVDPSQLGECIRVVIVAPHPVQRSRLFRGLRTCRDLDLVGVTTNSQEAMRLCPHVQPDVVVVDPSEAGVDGPALARLIRGRWPWVRVLVLGSATSAGEASPQEAAKGGDSLPDTTWRNVGATIGALCEQRTRRPGWNGSGLRLRAFPDQALWCGLRRGLSDAQIGEWLAVNELTARFYVGSVLDHLGLASRQDVVAVDHPDGTRARRSEMVTPIPEKREVAVGF
jgi:DNA-binding NarL/FixJ family response regulator